MTMMVPSSFSYWAWLLRSSAEEGVGGTLFQLLVPLLGPGAIKEQKLTVRTKKQ